MIDLEVPGFGPLRLEHLVLDFNGTLACDGALVTGVGPRIVELAKSLEVHAVTADTRGQAREALARLPCAVHLLESGAPEDEAKAAWMRKLGADRSVCIGNGRNDARMLREAALGIAVMQVEGLAREALEAADLMVPSMPAALDLLLHPLRLLATLRC